jgi:hypothetical protein
MGPPNLSLKNTKSKPNDKEKAIIFFEALSKWIL